MWFLYFLLEHVGVYWTAGAAMRHLYADRSDFPQESVARVLVNQLLVTPLMLACVWGLDHQTATEGRWPAWWEWGAAYGILDLCFYWTHYMAHRNRTAWRVHRVHHQWTISTSWAALDAHPLEMAGCNLFPLLAGPKLLGWGHEALRWWLLLATLNTLWVHARRPQVAGFHQAHHRKLHGNYGLDTGLWDRLQGTRL
jgi:sterol desaturase/sphingolipid hydroxylase (fatty acid hydroxylase superfamily)